MRVIPYQPKDLDGFWESRVKGWLVRGVRACIKRKVNIGATTLIFCYLDFFGSLIKPKAQSRQRFYSMVNDYLGPVNSDYSTYKCKLYKDFRCGLVHEAVMSKGTGIFRSSDLGDAGYEHMKVYHNALFLDLIQLGDDFVRAVGQLKADIDNDPKKKQRAVKRLRDLGWSLPKRVIFLGWQLGPQGTNCPLDN